MLKKVFETGGKLQTFFVQKVVRSKRKIGFVAVEQSIKFTPRGGLRLPQRNHQTQRVIAAVKYPADELGIALAALSKDGRSSVRASLAANAAISHGSDFFSCHFETACFAVNSRVTPK